jgi:integrase
MAIEFKVDNEIKQEYLDTKPTGTAESDAFVLRDFDNYEDQIGKQVYNLSIPELNEMFATLRNSSKRGAGKNKSILVSYIDFCVSKKIVSHMGNRAKYIDIEKFVSRQALLNKYIPREKVREYANLLYNSQDELLLWLLFIGVRGRTVEEGTMEEVINLTIDDVNEEEKSLTLRQNDGKFRLLYNVPDCVIDLIKETFEQEFYTENNGEITNNPRIPDPRKSIINKTGEYARYVFRTPGKNKFDIFTPSLLNSRMRKIQNVCDNKYLTYSSLYFSGMLQMCSDIYKEKGEVADRDFDDICIRFNYGIPESKEDLSKKQSAYWHVLKDLFNQYKDLLF